MNRNLVHPNEQTLFGVLAVMAALAWLMLTVVTVGMVWFFIGIGFFFYLFAQSRFISYFRGTGARITPEQFPDLYQAYEECCAELKMNKKPEMYLIQLDGMLNAFATRFLRKHYVILLADIVDALESNPEAIKFYIGHELGHVKRNHLMTGFWLAPVSWLPLIGAGYSRVCELTCDRHGQACCADEKSAVDAMSVLAVGTKRWKTMNVDSYLNQKHSMSGFWMSFHEITGNYPWLVRRIAYLHADRKKSQMPSLNPFAWLLGVFVPKMSIMSIIIIYFLFIFAFGTIGVVQGMRDSLVELENLEGFEEEYDFNEDEKPELGDRPPEIFYDTAPPMDVNPQETEDIIRELQEKLNRRDAGDGENP